MHAIKTITKFSDSEKGFTLVELIVVIGILSVLAVGSIIALNPFSQFQKANDSKRKTDLAQVQRALETYYQDNGKYPPHSAVTPPLYRIVRLDLTTADWGTQWQPYMNLLPKDPVGSDNYVYYSTGQSYYLYATLDRGTSDPQICKNLVNKECPSIAGNGIPANSCGGPCNFAATSPNVAP